MVRTLILLLLLPLHSKQFAAGRLLRTGEKVSSTTACMILACTSAAVRWG
jgi:hypothetical protein